MKIIKVCAPLAAAAVIAGAVYTSEDKAVLDKAGLCVVNGELTENCPPQARRSAKGRRSGPARIRQGGPVCWDMMLWPADRGPLPIMPAYAEAPYAAPVGIPLTLLPLSASERGFYDGIFNNMSSVFTSANYSNDTVNLDHVNIKPNGAVAVPEPSSLSLFLVCGLALGLAMVCFRKVNRA